MYYNRRCKNGEKIMKKQILLTLPLMAAMLASCGAKKSGGDAPIPDPAKGTVVENAVAAQNLSNAAMKTLAQDALGIAINASSNGLLEVQVPVGYSDEGKINWGKGYVKENLELGFEVNAKNLSQTGVQNYRGSAKAHANASAKVDIPEDVAASIGSLVKIDEDVLEEIGALDITLKGSGSAYFDGVRGFFEYDSDLVNAIQTITAMSGTHAEIPAAGKYRTPEIPNNEYTQNFNLASYIAPYAQQYLPYVQQLPELMQQYAQYFEKLESLKYSETEYALYAEVDVIKLLTRYVPQAGDYVTLIEGMLDDNDKLTAKAALVFDTELGIKSLGIELVVKADVTYTDVIVAVSDGAYTREQAKQMLGKDADVKMINIDVTASAGVELKVGTAVNVVELSEAQKGQYVDFPTSKTAISGQDL